VVGKESAHQKAVAARKTAADLRAKQAANARRNTILASIGALALVVVFVVVVMFIIHTEDESDPYTVYNNGVLKAPSIIDETDGILVGPNGVAGGVAPADAIRIDLIEDPLCPWCVIFDETASGEVGVLVDQGEVALYFHPVSILDEYSVGTHYSTRMTNAWFTVAEYDPSHFWAMVKASYADPPDEGTKGLKNDEIVDLARGAGVSEAAIARFSDGEFTLWIADSTERAAIVYSSEEGRFGTPTVLVGGVRFNYWSTPGNITAAVTYIKENGAEAFAEDLATPVEPSPLPSE